MRHESDTQNESIFSLGSSANQLSLHSWVLVKLHEFKRLFYLKSYIFGGKNRAEVGNQIRDLSTERRPRSSYATDTSWSNSNSFYNFLITLISTSNSTQAVVSYVIKMTAGRDQRSRAFSLLSSREEQWIKLTVKSNNMSSVPPIFLLFHYRSHVCEHCLMSRVEPHSQWH